MDWKEKLQELAGNAKKKADQAVDTGKTAMELRRVKKDIEALKKDLADCVLSKYLLENEMDSDLAELCAAIETQQDKADELAGILEAVKTDAVNGVKNAADKTAQAVRNAADKTAKAAHSIDIGKHAKSGKPVCPVCGGAVKSEFYFCPSCGAVLQEEEEYADVDDLLIDDVTVDEADVLEAEAVEAAETAEEITEEATEEVTEEAAEKSAEE